VKRKLQRFSEIELLNNVFQKDCSLKGRWNQDFFKKEAPITLELGCGRGEYTLALYNRNPENHFIGVDIKGARLWRGAKTAFEENLQGIGFLRVQIESLPDYFSENEVSEIWITFPDPHSSQRRERKRLTNPRFLEYYLSILKNQGIIRLKTDAQDLFDYSLQTLPHLPGKIISQRSDIHSGNPQPDDILEVLTTYEKIFMKEGKPIHYLSYQIHK
jgi:tRNA (guanine-N7-)-methyltransferase